MTIRNKRTGEVKEIDPSQGAQYGLPVAQVQPQAQEENVPFFSGARNVPVLGGLLSSPIQAGQNIAGAGFELARAADTALGNKRAYETREGQATIRNPFTPQETLESTRTNPLGFIAGQTAPAALAAIELYLLRGIGKGVSPYAKATTEARGITKTTVGKALEKKAVKAGEVPQQLFEKYFNAPEAKAKILENVGTASDKARMARLLQREIVTMGQSPGGNLVQGPKFIEMLRNRIGAYAKGAYAKGTPPTIENTLWRNIGRQYDEILKAGAETKNLDKMYGLLSKLERVKGYASPLIKWGIVYVMLQNLVGGITGGRR